jgi:hypothetical protein
MRMSEAASAFSPAGPASGGIGMAGGECSATARQYDSGDVFRHATEAFWPA